MDNFTLLIIGFVLGILASTIAAIVYEYGSRPKLKLILDDSPRALGQNAGGAPYEFYHLKIINTAAPWPIPSRKPAWGTRAIIRVLDPDCNHVIPDVIVGRWASQPEPVIPAIAAGQVGLIPDPARLVLAQKIDVHNHETQQLDVAIKYEGEPDCYIFSNESYLHHWRNPSWKLGNNTYRLRVTLYYERGRLETDFRFQNKGTSRDDVSLELWDLESNLDAKPQPIKHEGKQYADQSCIRKGFSFVKNAVSCILLSGFILSLLLASLFLCVAFIVVIADDKSSASTYAPFALAAGLLAIGGLFLAIAQVDDSLHKSKSTIVRIGELYGVSAVSLVVFGLVYPILDKVDSKWVAEDVLPFLGAFALVAFSLSFLIAITLSIKLLWTNRRILFKI